MRKIYALGLLALTVCCFAGCENQSDEGTPFSVIQCDPAGQQTNVPLSSAVSIRFTHPVNHTTIIGTRQILLVNQSNAVIPASFQFNGEYVHLTPGSPLATNATFGIAVRTGVQDVYGNNLSTPFAITFATGSTLATIPNWPPFTAPTGGGPGSLGPPGTFTPVGPLNTPRARHTAIRLHDGRVFVTGGESQPNFAQVERSAEIFDPNTLSWTYSQSNQGLGMVHRRCGHTATLLTNGKVFVAGGAPNKMQAHNTAEIYDPVTDTFTLVPGTMTVPRMFHSANRLPNGNVLLAFGATSTVQTPVTGTVLTDTMEVFDVNSGTFHQCPSRLPTGIGLIYHTSTVLPDNTVMITGGLTFLGGPAASRATHIYAPDLNGIGFQGNLDAFNASRSLKNFRCEHRTVMVPEGEAAGLVLVVGGMFSNGVHISSEGYDFRFQNPGTGVPGKFNFIANNMSVTRRSHTATYIPSSAFAGRSNPRGRILVVG
ncbi:MAG: kelch repeat-containing protein, partial [Planctomycetota bacterium]